MSTRGRGHGGKAYLFHNNPITVNASSPAGHSKRAPWQLPLSKPLVVAHRCGTLPIIGIPLQTLTESEISPPSCNRVVQAVRICCATLHFTGLSPNTQCACCACYDRGASFAMPELAREAYTLAIEQGKLLERGQYHMCCD